MSVRPEQALKIEYASDITQLDKAQILEARKWLQSLGKSLLDENAEINNIIKLKYR
jgi:hypothetical protein